MRKINKLGWSMLLLMGFMLFGTSSAKALDLPIDEGFTPQTFTDYTFTPATSGSLTMTTTGDPIFYFWLETPLLSQNGTEVPVASSNGNAGEFKGATTISWNLTGGNTYTFHLAVDRTPAELGTYTFTYTGGTGGGSDTPGTGDDKSIQLGVPFNVPAIAFGGTPEAYPFTSPFTGTLKIETNKWFGLCDTWGPPYTTYFFFKDKNGNNPMVATAMEDGTEGYTLLFDVTENTTYYVIFDDAVTLTFLKGESTGGGGGDTGNVLPVPTTNFTLSQNMYTYTPSVNGILTIVYQDQPWDNCLYSSWEGNHGGVKVPLQEGIDPNTATTFSWAVEGGHTYYLDSSYPANNVVTTSFEAGGGSENPGGEEIDGYAPVQLNKDYEIADGETLAVYFTAPANGELKISQWGTEDPFLFLAPTKNPEDYSNMAPNEGYMGSDPCVFTYLVEKGTTYYYYGVHDQASWRELYKVSFAFEETSGGGGDQPGGGDGPEGYSAMQMNQRYTTGSVGAVMLAFTPTASGKLIATQTGSYESHLFSAAPKYSSDYGYDNNYDILIPSTYEAETTATVFPLEYGVAAGVTYYYVAKLMTGDPISAVEFSFEEITGGNEIQLNTPYMVSSSDGLYTFTADQTGVLSVQWSNPLNPNEPCYNTGIVWGAQQYFFYSDPGLSQPVGMLSQGDGQGGWLVTFGVEEGKTYYFHAPEATKYQVVFSFEAGDVEASVVVINPTPGTAYNVVDYRYYMNVLTAPASSTVERVTLTYIPTGQKEATTIEMSGQPQNFGELQIPVDDLVSRIENGSIEPETDVTITLYGLKAGGEYVTKNALVNGNDYVTIGENGLVTITYTNGTPIALLNSNFPSPFRRAWERGDKEGIATLTYDQEIYVVGDVTVTAGRHYYGSESGGENVYSQTLPHQNVSWEGNTVTLDFTGINWNMPSGTSEVTIMVTGPTGMNMLPASYDGIPVLQEYLPFTTEGAEIDEPIISYIDPLDGVTFGGIFEDETIQITLLENFMNAYSLVGVLTDIEGGEYGTYDFDPTPRGTWVYEVTDDVVFYEDMTYLFTVTAYAEDGTKLGSQVVYWYGNTPRGEQPEPEDIWYVRCNANNFNPNGDAKWALLPSENEEENGIYTGKVTLTKEFSFNLLDPNGNVFIPMNLETYDPENVEVEFVDNAYYGNTDMAYSESEEAMVWTVAGYEGVELTISLDLNDAYITLSLPDGSGVQINMADGSAVYFDLQGRKIANPDKGIYIKVQDGKATKVVK